MANADRIIDLLHEAKARPAGAEREQFLAGACQEDLALKEQILSLLEADAAEGESDFLKLTRIIRPSILPSEKAGDRIGRYKLLEQIGEGGCGIVYVAEQEEPVRRRVALKVVKLGMDTKQVIARFDAERQALALMDHPNIAKVLDAGATETGRPYFVMELVRGIKITDYCNQSHLPPRERLDLFIQVCKAIQHAHQKGVIHRDIKPSNILVTLHDGVPVPKVIDFGIAKATQGRLTDQTVYTAFEQFIGTPAYMSPEQAEMSGLDIDTRSDIYSLGVLLYELLTGTTPFDAKELLSKGLDEMRRTIREVEPVKPSTRLTQELSGRAHISLKLGSATVPVAESGFAPDSRSTSQNPSGESQSHEVFGATPKTARETCALPKSAHRTPHFAIPSDLDWIVMKCLEKERVRRYETANGLAADIQRHLDCEVVLARPPSRLYEFQKTVRRHKFGFAAAGAVVAALIVGLGLSTWWFLRERETQAAQRKSVDRNPLDVAKTLFELSLQLRDGGKLPEAESTAREALAIRKQVLGEQHAEVAQALHLLAWNVNLEGRHAEAESLSRQELAIRRKLFGNDDVEVGNTLGDLAWYLRDQGKMDELDAVAREAIAIFEKLAADPPRSDLLENVGQNEWHLAMALDGKPDLAQRTLQDSLEVFERAGRDFPQNRIFPEEQAASHHFLGDWAVKLRNIDGAEQHYRSAISLYAGLKTNAPQNASYSKSEAWMTWWLAHNLNLADRPESAFAEFRAALTLHEQAMVKFPADTEFKLRRDGARAEFISMLRRHVPTLEAAGQTEKAAAWKKQLAELDEAQAGKQTAVPKP